MGLHDRAREALRCADAERTASRLGDAYRMDQRCRATTRSGQPCRARHFREGWCRFHDPALDEARARDRRAGGHAKANDRRARKELERAGLSPGELDGLLSSSMRRVAAGEMEPPVATALGSLARALIAVREAHDVTARLDALETTLSQRKGVQR